MVSLGLSTLTTHNAAVALIEDATYVDRRASPDNIGTPPPERR